MIRVSDLFLFETKSRLFLTDKRLFSLFFSRVNKNVFFHPPSFSLLILQQKQILPSASHLLLMHLAQLHRKTHHQKQVLNHEASKHRDCILRKTVSQPNPDFFPAAFASKRLSPSFRQREFPSHPQSVLYRVWLTCLDHEPYEPIH